MEPSRSGTSSTSVGDRTTWGLLMRIRRMAVSTAAVAAAVTGVVVVQSGIPGTGMLPIVRHAGAPAAPEGPGLPAPGATVLPPPSAGVVQDVSATPTVVRTGTRSAGRPAATQHRSGKNQRS